MTSPTANRPKILYLVTEDWYFWSHRLPMARAARNIGFEVVVATRINKHREKIEAEGFRVVPLSLERKGKNPLKELAAIRAIAKVYKDEQPDLVHHVALKPILYGSIAARLVSVPRVINAFAGMGFVFIAESGLARLARPFLVTMLRFLFAAPNSHLVLQNNDDVAMFKDLGLGVDTRRHLIKGSGVDLEEFPICDEMPGDPVVTFVGRMLWDKGIGELVEAAKELKNKGLPVTVQLVGTPDPANPKSIPEETLRKWNEEGVVSWLGQRSDIAALWAGSHMAVLPSYREGLPKSLLEAAACGRAMIATDVPGCRELVNHGGNGLLVPVRESAPLAEAIERLALNAEERKAFGAQARLDIEAEYAAPVVSGQISALYQSLMGDGNAVKGRL